MNNINECLRSGGKGLKRKLLLTQREDGDTKLMYKLKKVQVGREK